MWREAMGRDGMRDLLLLVIILGSVPISLFEPFYGVLVWIWISYFNPHRFTFSYMYEFPVAAVIAVPTLLGILFTRKINRNPMVRETALLGMLWIWFVITYLNATRIPLFQGHILDAKSELIRVSKILLMTVVMILLVNTRERLKYLFLVTSLSFSLLVLKGALFGARTSGQYRVWGPPDSFLADNNGFAMAVNMSLPMLFYLGRVEENRLLKRILNISFICGIVSVLLTYSRGGLLGLVAVMLTIVLKSRYRVLSGIVLVACGLLVLTFAPEKWMERMGTLKHESENVDDSAHQRLVSWGTTLNFSKDYPIMGGSFDTLPDIEVFQRYESEPLPGGFPSSGPHSIYFQVIGEQGYVGLILYLALIGCCMFSLRRIRSYARRITAMNWSFPYLDILETAFIGFLVSGAFLGLANFDLFYQLIACTIILKILVRRELATHLSSGGPETAILVESPVA
jgi:probable O-glycosylation ligase (exosortase A-associated)